MKRFLILIMLASLCLSGCSWFRGSYVSVTPHEYTGWEQDPESVSASDYVELCSALKNMVRDGQESCVIDVSGYDSSGVEWDMGRAVSYVRQSDPIGAYAVENIQYELGTSGNLPAVAVEIAYRHGGSELRQIQSVRDMDSVQTQVGKALERCDSDLVLLVHEYVNMDIQQMAEDYAEDHPDTVMEAPTVIMETYPSAGAVRVLALRFTYQNSRDDLREMKQQVSPVFASASLYVSGDDADDRKYSQLYAFLKERFGEYQIKTSITPAYSLLRHGVGDSRAFAMVYARMCSKAGLNCRVVTGTRDGEAWCWNMVCVEGNYFHLDLLNRKTSGAYQLMTDSQMDSYVWDYSAYPVCTGEVPGTEQGGQDQPQSEPTESAPTVPEETTAPVPTETVTPETMVPPVVETTQPPETEVPTVPEETTQKEN